MFFYKLYSPGNWPDNQPLSSPLISFTIPLQVDVQWPLYNNIVYSDIIQLSSPLCEIANYLPQERENAKRKDGALF